MGNILKIRNSKPNIQGVDELKSGGEKVKSSGDTFVEYKPKLPEKPVELLPGQWMVIGACYERVHSFFSSTTFKDCQELMDNMYEAAKDSQKEEREKARNILQNK